MDAEEARRKADENGVDKIMCLIQDAIKQAQTRISVKSSLLNENIKLALIHKGYKIRKNPGSNSRVDIYW